MHDVVESINVALHGLISTSTVDVMEANAAEGSSRRAQGLSALGQRLPGQRTPPDPNVEQPNAADLTYGWHLETDSGDEHRANRSEEDDDWLNDDFTDAESEAEQHDRIPADTGAARPAATPWGISSSRLGSSSSLWQRWHRRGEEVPGDSTLAKEEERQNAAAQESAANAENSFICRICFDGPGSFGEGGESLGKLIAPCKCRGTMKFVHQRCLRRWRSTSQRQSSVMQCDQCGAPYRFKKSPFVGLATNKPLLVLMSCFLFVSLVWTVGFAAEIAVRRMDADKGSHRAGRQARVKSRFWWPFGGEADEDRSSTTSRWRLYQEIDLDRSTYETEDVYADSFFDYRYDYRYVYSEPAAYVTLIKAAVKYVGSGQAFKHLFRESEEAVITDVQEDENSLTDNLGWWATLKDDWLYGKGGLREGKRPQGSAEQSWPSEDANSDTMLLPSESSKPFPDPPQDTAQARTRYDSVTARDVKPGEKVARPVTRKQRSKQRETGRAKAGWLERLTLQLSLGASLVGMSSFLSILLGISTWAPFHLNLGLGRGFARFARRRGGGGRGGGGGGSNEGEALVAVFLLFLVIVGIIRALFAVYRLTTYLSRRLLTRVEDIILDWGHDDEAERSPPRPDHQTEAQQRRMHEQLDAALDR